MRNQANAPGAKNSMLVIMRIDHKEIENLKPLVDEIRYKKGVQSFVREYDKVYKDLVKAKMLNS